MQPKLVVSKHLTTEYDVYIGRPSEWGNPYRVGFDGLRGKCVKRFEADVCKPAKAEFRAKVKSELVGKRLACFCAGPKGLDADDPLICHGQILLRIIRGDYDEKIKT